MNVTIQFVKNSKLELRNNDELTIQLKLSQTETTELQHELANICDSQNSSKLTKILQSMLNFETATVSKF